MNRMKGKMLHDREVVTSTSLTSNAQNNTLRLDITFDNEHRHTTEEFEACSAAPLHSKRALTSISYNNETTIPTCSVYCRIYLPSLHSREYRRWMLFMEFTVYAKGLDLLPINQR